MRDSIRGLLQLLMVLFLLVGCFHNIYYFQNLTENNGYGNYNKRYSPYSRTSTNTYNYDDEINDIDEVVVTPSDSLDEEEYTRRGRTSSYQY